MSRYYNPLRRGPDHNRARHRIITARNAIWQAARERFHRYSVGEDRRELRKWLGEDYPWYARREKMRSVSIFKRRENPTRRRLDDRDIPF